jgi:hypothetical protein
VNRSHASSLWTFTTFELPTPPRCWISMGPRRARQASAPFSVLLLGLLLPDPFPSKKKICSLSTGKKRVPIHSAKISMGIYPTAGGSAHTLSALIWVFWSQEDPMQYSKNPMSLCEPHKRYCCLVIQTRAVSYINAFSRTRPLTRVIYQSLSVEKIVALFNILIWCLSRWEAAK